MGSDGARQIDRAATMLLEAKYSWLPAGVEEELNAIAAKLYAIAEKVRERYYEAE